MCLKERKTVVLTNLKQELKKGEAIPERVLVSAEDAAQKTEVRRAQHKERQFRYDVRQAKEIWVVHVDISMGEIAEMLEFGFFKNTEDAEDRIGVGKALGEMFRGVLEECERQRRRQL